MGGLFLWVVPLLGGSLSMRDKQDFTKYLHVFCPPGSFQS